MKVSTYYLLAILVVSGIYLFVTAPPPLEAEARPQAKIPVVKALEIVNDVHARVRKLYTSEIVGAGLKQGLKFREDWEEIDVLAGPLPAQFLREVARSLEQSPVPLGLFLASDFAINEANKLEGEQLAHFIKMKKANTPLFSYVEDIARYTYMVPDIAVAKPCVQCHNEHKDSPKTDWKEGDIMGATTWSFPREFLSYTELFDLLTALNDGVRSAYKNVIDEFSQLPNAPAFGKLWPREGYVIPTVDEFMQQVSALNAVPTLQAMTLLHKKSKPLMFADNN
ncbi:MAG: DUF3365 domain-containing protein [Gammaproteobacteria bacterium]|nr:DUF3365 domain-containing protein [Gammaproteobacteria bacterium]